MKAAKSTGAELRSVDAHDRGGWVVRLLWLGAACSVTGMAIFLPFAWDAKDYLLAIRQYSAYVSGQGSSSLAYSPLFMIPTLKVAKLFPLWLTVALFSLAYLAGWLIQLWVGMQCATEEERKLFRYVIPVIAFFPGLLISDVIISGNLAYILYGMMLAGAALGWKRGCWGWFYLAVLAAACVKVHLLTMLAIPLLCGRRQWMRTLLTAGAGLGLYLVQPRIWPGAFHLYLNSLQAMSQSQRDFGCGPTGNLARVLEHFGVAYYKPCLLFYVAYVVVLFTILLTLSKLYHAQRVSFLNWAPVMLLGVVLLNPRILTYDVAAVSLPMALIAWRSLRESVGKAVQIGAAALLIVLNVFVAANNEGLIDLLPNEQDAWKYMFLMLGIFASGVWMLLKEAGIEPFAAPSYVPESEVDPFGRVDA